MAQEEGRLEFFEKRIRPVLVEHCYKCHGADVGSIKGGLRVDFRDGIREGGDSGPAVSPGEPDESLLLSALKYDGYEMPPKGKLPKQVIKDFEIWIRNGAVDPREQPTDSQAPHKIDVEKSLDFWAFKRPAKELAPKVADKSQWAKSNVDRFILARLEEKGIHPSTPADRRVLIRRAYLDLIGLPPTPEQVDAFLNDTSAQAFERVVDELLESPHYGERWGRRWLDVARYGEDQAHTFKARRYPRGYLYRDWVVRALNEDMPYDDFLRWQIAGDLLEGPDRHERLAALGLFALGPVYYAENVEKDRAAADEWDDRIDTLTRGVLGLTVSCARCHDHKFDPITMQDYYGLAGVFASTNYQERPTASDDQVARRRRADDEVKKLQASTDRYLAAQAKQLRPRLLDDVPAYFVAAWKFRHGKSDKKNDKKLLSQLAKEHKLNADLIRRWSQYLGKRKHGAAEADWLTEWLDFAKSAEGADQKTDDATLARVQALGERFRDSVKTLVPRKDKLFARFGDNAAFAKKADLVEVSPGVIPLGNLFDDPKSVSLDAALRTDRFSAEAKPDRLGVANVAQGWGEETQLVRGIRFHFGKVGSSSHGYGSIVNDAWQRGGSLRTRGARGSGGKRDEQGIGMHANALVTFDIDEIRKAGLLPGDQAFKFKVDRGGLNDDVIGSAASAYLMVIVSKPHKDKNVTDAILAAYVNGRKVDVDVNDFTYYFSGDVGKPLRPDGTHVSFDIEIPADARYVTLVTTGAGEPDDNRISSDHTVFSGARLEQNPLPKPERLVDRDEAGESIDVANEERDRKAAVLLSRLFYDEGLLALPAKDAEAKLNETSKQTLKRMRDGLAEEKKKAEAINILMAHSLTEGGSRDLPIYLQGNPAKKGEVAPRAMPAIFTSGKKLPFNAKGSGRFDLAEAIASPENPLTARVIVNRVWAGHFGVGLVKTTSNFGSLGDRPSHPRLLDDLAARFMANGWSLKWLHREIMRSAVYQQSSTHRGEVFEVDPENRLLWRMNRRRLEVEPWRDSLLAVCGELDDRLGGPSADLGNNSNRRRTLYGFVSRHRLNELLRLFDFPDPNITAAERPVTTVPLQQLFVLNSDFMTLRAKAFAKRVMAQKDSPIDEQIQLAYRLALGREADPSELDVIATFVGGDQQQGDQLNRWEQFALALLSSNEFMFID